MWWFWTALLNGMVSAGGYWTARHAFRQPAGLPRMLAAATLYWAWVTVGVELFGALGWLGLDPLLAWSALGMAVGLTFRLKASSDPKGASAEGAKAWEPAATLSLALAIWGAVILGMQSLLLPVKVVSDGPIYHLYFAARWWKEGRLFLIATPFGENAAPYFPANGDVWFTWLMTCWGGDRLARVGQAPFLLLAALASCALARRIGVGLPAAVVATCWFVTCTPLFLFSFEPNVDTIFVASYLVAAYFFLRFALHDGEFATLALGELAAGGALGTKATGVVFVPVLLAAVAAAVARRRWTPRRRLLGLASIVLIPLVMTGFWFARNTLCTGNPLYPLHLEALGRTWLPGWYGREVMRKSQYFLAPTEWRAGCDILSAVLDPRLALVWFAALAGAWAVGNRTGPLSKWVHACSVLAVLNVGLYWLLIPYRTQQRFMLHALGLAAVPLGCLFDRGRWIRLAASLLLVLHVLTPQTWPIAETEREIPWDLDQRIPNAIPSFLPIPTNLVRWSETFSSPDRLTSMLFTCAVGVGALATAWVWGRAAQRSTWGRSTLALFSTLGLATATGIAVFPWGVQQRWSSFPFFPEYNRGWAALEQFSGPHGARIAYAGTNLPYYLMCFGLRNDVQYVNVNDHAHWLLHDYHRALGQPTTDYPRPEWDRSNPDFRSWLSNLRAAKIQMVVVARANPVEAPHVRADSLGFPIERQWAESDHAHFTPLYGVVENDPQFRIYRIQQ